MSRSLQVFTACALGAGIGTMVALQLHPYFWWIGLVVGGAIGYLSYEPKQVLSAVGQAWREVIGYRPSRQGITRVMWVATAIISYISGLVLVIVVATEIVAILPTNDSSSLTPDPLALLISGLIVIYIFCYTMFAFAKEEIRVRSLEVTGASRKWILLTNPVTVLLVWPALFIGLAFRGLWKFTLWFGKSLREYTPLVISAVIRFTKTVFIMIHSKERLLCGVDAAIGSAIGFFFGNPIVGALAGGVIGILNFEIVSRRILHISFEKG